MIQFSIHRSELIHFGELKTESFSGLCRLNLENIFRLGGGGCRLAGKYCPTAFHCRLLLYPILDINGIILFSCRFVRFVPKSMSDCKKTIKQLF